MINKINNCKNRAVVSSFNDIEEVVNFIKSPPQEHIEYVGNARTLERKSKEYNYIKIHKLPAITINFSFSNNYISGKNVSNPTGYLYFDVDGMTEQDFEINTTYVCAYWRSLSDTGMTLVVKVDGLTPDNFKEATKEVARLLDIPYDEKAVSIDRLTILSYDSNAYFNDNTEVIPLFQLLSPDLTVSDEKEAAKNTHYNSINTNNIKKLSKYDCNGYKIRFDNLDELLESKNIKYDENGFYDFGKDSKLRYAKVFIPFTTIESDRRYYILEKIILQLVALNKKIPKKIIHACINKINNNRMIPPIESQAVEDLLDKTYKNIKNIEPHFNEERRFIYDKTKNLTTKEKRSLNMKQLGKDKSNKSKTELFNVMKEWDFTIYGKITIKNLSKTASKNKKTVQKYYKELKAKLAFISLNTLKNSNTLEKEIKFNDLKNYI
ncbi:BT4734/BF3469 family protein [Chryseobacterium limigenitum]|nr:BT4734/BF3469 family protein [Chryseobacterium limigenitum]